MSKEVFKLKLLADDGSGEDWLDLYLDVNTIQGFFIPYKEDNEEPCLNIFVGGDIITILQEEHIKNWLVNNFVKQ